MLARMLLTPSVIIVRRAIGPGGLWFILILRAASEQTQLLPAALGTGKMIGGQLRTPLVEPEFLAGDLEAAPDHPGHRPGALHPRSPLRVIIAPAAHVADQREDVAIAVGIVRHQPLAEE